MLSNVALYKTTVELHMATVSRSPFLAVCCRWGQKNPRSLGETHVIGKKRRRKKQDCEDTIMWHHLVRGSTCNDNSQARQNYNL